MVKQDKPFIKLLRSPNSGYFFDVNRNELVPVDDEIYEILRKEQEDVPFELSNEQASVINELRNNGYLSSKRVRKIEHYLTDHLETILERNVEKITLQLTQDCNFRCNYCSYTSNNGAQRTHAQKKMEYETAKRAIDFLWKHSVDSTEVNIGLYGGEPLLEFELIKRVVEYADKRFLGKKLTYSITTNASLLNDEIVDYLSAHNCMAVISIDGSKEVHDKQRVFAGSGKGTFDTVIQKLSRACKHSEDFAEKLTLNIVMDPSNDFDQIKRLFSEYEFTNCIRISSTIIDDSLSEEKNNYTDKFIAKYRYSIFIAMLNFLEIVSDCYVSPIAAKALTTFRDKSDMFVKIDSLIEICAPSGPCIPGKTRPLITVDGKIILCERVSETSDCMIIGDIYNGFDYNKVSSLVNIGQLTEEKCKQCWVFLHCGVCARYADDKGTLSGEEKMKHCKNNEDDLVFLLQREILTKEYYTLYHNGGR